MALPVPRSTSSEYYGLGQTTNDHRRKHTLQEERKESDHEHQEDTDNTPVDPLERRLEIVASCYPKELPTWGVLADRKLTLQGTEEHH